MNKIISAIVLSLIGLSVPSGATQIFNYPNGFAGAENAIQTTTDASGFSGSVITLTNGTVGQHESGAAWYKIQQNIQAFTTDFTFQLAAVGPGTSTQGITFCVQNSNSTTNPLSYGSGASSDANGLGYAAYAPLSGQYPIYNSIAVKFDLSGMGQTNYVTSANATGLYINGGPSIETSGGLIPENDLNPYGINLHSGDIMAAHIVYDGSVLTMTLRDTVTNAQARYSWPIDIPTAIGSNSAWIGFTGGEIPTVAQNLLTWSFSEGYAPEISAPGFSVAGGSYTSSQMVSISANPGATIYYTTNGLQPTSSSTQYTGPISVSSSEVVQAIAVEAGYTDSLVATANYEIAPAGTPIINFPGGFSASSNLVTLTGASQLSGSALQLTDTIHEMESSAAWYVAPVNVQSFTTNFTLQFLKNPNSQQVANGLTFTIQNQNPTSTDSSSLYVSGGPNAIGNNQSGLGYAGLLNSVAVVFDITDSGGTETGDLTGLYTNGANPVGSSIDMTSSRLNLLSGNPLAVTATYDGTTLAMTITDTVTKASFSKSWAINIPSTVGANTAYVGFTASTGFQIAGQKVLSWTYNSPNSKAAQTISNFPSTQALTLSESPYTLPATTSAGLTIIYTVVSGAATVSGNTLTLTGAGTVVLQAGQAGNGTYAPIVVTQTITVDQTFAQWEAQPGYFTSGQLGNQAIIGPTATPQNDTVPNLLKYLYDINPTRPMTSADRAGLPVFATTTTAETTYLTLTYGQYAYTTGITLTVQTSPDLINWTTLNSSQYTNLPTDTNDPNGDPYMQIEVPMTGSRQFIRLSVSSA